MEFSTNNQYQQIRVFFKHPNLGVANSGFPVLQPLI